MIRNTVGAGLAAVLLVTGLALSAASQADASPAKVRHPGRSVSQQRSGEIKMIELQSVVSQRQQALTLTTKLTQPCKQCIQNIR